MLRFLWIIFEILLCALAGCIAFVIIASILDFLRGNNNQNATVKKSSSSGSSGEYYATHKRMGYSNQIDRDIDAAAARVAQDAHNTAVRDSQWLHDDACRTAHESHDTAVFDHQAAVDLHEHVISDPGFGCCGPFF